MFREITEIKISNDVVSLYKLSGMLYFRIAKLEKFFNENNDIFALVFADFENKKCKLVFSEDKQDGAFNVRHTGGKGMAITAYWLKKEVDFGKEKSVSFEILKVKKDGFIFSWR